MKNQQSVSVTDCYVRISQKTLIGKQKRPSRPLPVIGLSEYTIQFASRKYIQPGQKLKLWLNLPAYDQTIELTACVTWCNKIQDNAYKTEAVFKHVPRRKAEMIRSVVDDPLMRSMKQT